MRISEIFYSLQGEGLLTGVPSVFVRVAGCPMRCKWCDTKYAWEESSGQEYTVEKVLETITGWKCKYVVITGGEPLAGSQKKIREVIELARMLRDNGKHITIETAGIEYVEGLDCDLMSISPKMKNSVPSDEKLALIHRPYILRKKLVRNFIENYPYQLKFVIDSEEDLGDVEKFVDLTGAKKERVFLMPQCETRDEFLNKSGMVAEMCKRTGFVFGQRLQILLYDGWRGL